MSDQDRGNKKALSQAPRDLELAEKYISADLRVNEPGISLIDEEQDKGFDLREFWRVIVKRKITILLFLCIVLIVGAVHTFLQTPLYQATLTMQIARQAAQAVEVNDPSQSNAGFANYYDFYQSQYEILRSRSLAEKVTELLAQKPMPEPAVKPALRELLTSLKAQLLGGPPVEQEMPKTSTLHLGAGAVQVSPVRNSSLVRLTFVSANPQLAALVVNAWADTYMSYNLEQRFGITRAAREFLEEQLVETREKLEVSERALVDFADKEGIMDVEGRENIVSNQLNDLVSALGVAEQTRLAAELTFKELQRSGPSGLRIVLESGVIQALKERRTALEVEYQERLKVYKPAYPAMQQLASQISEVKQNINGELRNIQQMIEADYETAIAREQAIREQLESVKQDVMALQNRTIHQYNVLKRDVDTYRGLYDSLLQRYKELDVASAIEKNNVSIIDSAQVPNAPFKPNVKRNLSITFILGLLGGIGLALLFERLDDTLKAPEDIERLLGIPVLGVIPVQKGSENSALKKSLAMIAHDDPQSSFAEAYRSVRTALAFSTSQGVPRVLLVTSTGPHEGKSTSALSLAIQTAQTGKKVLLVDCDLRKPSIHQMLNADNNVGLTNYLAGEARPAEIAKSCPIPNLFVVSTGHLPPNPVELLASAKMVSLLSLASKKFDQVILDCPPVLGLADALILGNLADATILVVEAGETRKGHAQGALKRLRVAHTRVVGSVISKFDNRHHAYGYGYGDYYYYNYDYGSKEAKQLPAQS